MISYNNAAPKAVNNVGQFGATEGSIGAYKSAAEYAADAKYWALLSQTKYSSIEEILAEVERLYAQGRLLEDDIEQLKNDFEAQEQTLLGLIQSTSTAIDNTNAATELSKEATQEVLAQLDIISNMTVQATLLPPGSLATGSYDNSTGVFSFGIPEGQPGRDGTDGTVSDIGSVPVGTPVSDDYGFYVDKDDGGLYRADMSDIANLVPSVRSVSINGGAEQTGVVSFSSVSSFNSRVGDVTPEAGDYSVSQITGAAKSGENSDITSLSGLTTPLSIAQGGTGASSPVEARNLLGLGSTSTENIIPINKGGTGATSATSARANLGLGLVAVESVLPINKGGTGSTSAENARLALVAAKSGENSDITSFTNSVTFTQPVNIADASSSNQAVALGQISAPDGFGLIGSCPSVDALRSIEPRFNQQRVYVSSHTEGGSLGGGYFYYDSADSTTEDDDGVTIVTTTGKRWKRVCTHISTDYYGLVAGSGTSVDSAVVINKALIAATNSSEAKVVVSKGAFYTNTVIKVPSSVTLCGSGVYATAIIASPSMPRITNVVQNSKHVYQQFGTDYNEDIRIENIVLDGNNRARNTTETWVDATQGTVLLLATTRKSVVSRVWVRRGIQHCLDISAGYYFDDGNINNNAVGGSYDILIEDCLGQNAQLDDVFTMHNSDMVKFIRCKAWNDDPDMVWAGNQHGFEIDEGSSNVTVRDCEAVNFISGFQQKGHDTTMPARNVTFDNCIARDCVMSFQVEHRHPSTIPGGQHQNARSSRIVNCTSVNANNSKNTSLHARAVYVDGFYGVFVNNLRVDGGSGNIYLTRGANGVYVNGVTFDGGYGISDTTSDGLIYVETGAGCDNYHFSDIVVSDAVSVPVFRDFNAGGLNRSLRNIYANGSSSSIPMIYMVPGLIDNISGLTPHNTWACALRDAERGPGNGDYLNTVSFVSGVSTQVGAGNPNNGAIAGKAGALYIDIGTGGVAGDRYHCTDTGVDHWVKVTTQ